EDDTLCGESRLVRFETDHAAGQSRLGENVVRELEDGARRVERHVLELEMHVRQANFAVGQRVDFRCARLACFEPPAVAAELQAFEYALLEALRRRPAESNAFAVR